MFDWVSKDAVTVATWDTSAGGKLVICEPSPLKYEAVTAPNRLIEPVIMASVTTTDCIDGVPLSFSKNIFQNSCQII